MTQVEQFESEFWPRYPRKEKKIAARDAWRWAMQNHNQDGQLVEKIVAALTWQTEVHSEWKYWTSPDRWLLGQRWTDEPPQKPMSAFERERHERHQRSLAQQMEFARRREQAS